MPPEIPPALRRATGGKIEVSPDPGEAAILSFYNLEGAGLAIRASAFTVEEEFRTLINHIRSDDEMVSLRAQSQFRKTLGEMVQVNGRILTASQTVDAQGRIIQQSATSARLISSLQKDNSSGLQNRALPYGEDLQDPIAFGTTDEPPVPDGDEDHLSPDEAGAG